MLIVMKVVVVVAVGGDGSANGYTSCGMVDRDCLANGYDSGGRGCRWRWE